VNPVEDSEVSGPPSVCKMDRNMGRLKELSFKRITVWVLKDNTRARKFYEKHGFTLDDIQKTIEIGKPLIEVRYSIA
jgi:RimJ/RimL family protein N-acetyltransferase